jgi:hypothetical protein
MKSLRLLVLSLLFSAPVFAQTLVQPGGGGGGIPITTVAGLASVSGKTAGTIAVVTNGNSATDCGAGAGTTIVTCQYSGSAWTAFAGSFPQTKTITGADWTCGTAGTVSDCTSPVTIGALSFTLPLVAATWSFDCNLIVGQATAATANYWDVQTATNAATNITASYLMSTATGSSKSGAIVDQISSTSSQAIGVAWTLGGAATQMPAHIWGTVEGASASGTVLNIQLVAPTVADLVTIYRGSSCRVY